MLARQGPQREQPFLGRFQRMGVEIQRSQRVLDPARGLPQLDQRTGQRGQRLVQATVGLLGCALQPARGIDHRAFGTVAGQHLQGTRHVVADAFSPLHGAAGHVQTLLLSGFGGQLVQFGHGVAQELFLLAGGGQRGFGFGQGAGSLAAGGPSQAD